MSAPAAAGLPPEEQYRIDCLARWVAGRPEPAERNRLYRRFRGRLGGAARARFEAQIWALARSMPGTRYHNATTQRGEGQ